MLEGFPKYVTTAQLGRIFGIDPRTAARRASLAGLSPDAELMESTGNQCLWLLTHERIRALHAAIMRNEDPMRELQELVEFSRRGLVPVSHPTSPS